MNVHALPRFVGLLLAGLGLAVIAHAEEYGSASFTLDPLSLTSLAPTPDAPRLPGTVGTWWTGNWVQTTLISGHVSDEPVRSFIGYTLQRGLEFGPPFGDGALQQAAPQGSVLSTEAHSGPNNLGVSWRADVPTNLADVDISWYRTLKLDPFASITISGIATLDRSDSHPLAVHYRTEAFSDDAFDVATLSLRDDQAYRHEVSLRAWMLNRDPFDRTGDTQGRSARPDDFTYSADSFGVLSLTVHNNSSLPLFTALEVTAFSSIQAIPEPATALMMLLGIGLVAWRLRRRVIGRLAPLLLAGFATSGLVHAEEHGSASFTLDPLSLISLAPTPDAPRLPGSVGTWWTGNWVNSSLSSGHANGDNVRHDIQYPIQNGLDFSPPFGVGARQQPPLPGSVLSTEAHSGPNNLGVSWRTDLPTDTADTEITWYRAFKLDPYASLTLSGIATLTRSDDHPLTTDFRTDTVNDEYYHVATLSLRDEQAYRHEVSLQAWMLNRDPFHNDAGSQGRVASPDDFTYSADSFGVLSLTVHNNSALPLFAAFELIALSNPMAAVPEPATAIAMALGTGLVAWRLRRRGSPTLPAPAPA